MPPDRALLSTLTGSNYPCLELIFMVPKMSEPLKFYCIYQQIEIKQKAAQVTVFNPIALRKAKIVYNFGLSECNRVKGTFKLLYNMVLVLSFYFTPLKLYFYIRHKPIYENETFERFY